MIFEKYQKRCQQSHPSGYYCPGINTIECKNCGLVMCEDHARQANVFVNESEGKASGPCPKCGEDKWKWATTRSKDESTGQTRKGWEHQVSKMRSQAKGKAEMEGRRPLKCSARGVPCESPRTIICGNCYNTFCPTHFDAASPKTNWNKRKPLWTIQGECPSCHEVTRWFPGLGMDVYTYK